MNYQKINVPANAEKIVLGKNQAKQIPNNPIIPFIEGDGIGKDITPVMQKVVDAAVQKAYNGEKKIAWMEVFAGEKAVKTYGEGQFFPDETFAALKEFRVSIKGPMTTAVGSGLRSLNVALRQELDLYQCVRPVRYFSGVPSPLKKPELVDMVIFRENTEDIYAGIEWNQDSAEVAKVIEFLQTQMGVKKIRFPKTSSIGIKPVSVEGSQRLIRAAIQYAINNNRKSVTLVHKGNIMKFTEGMFKNVGYELAKTEFAAQTDADGNVFIQNPQFDNAKIIIKDAIADNFLQQILLRPAEYDVIATTNLNGDYISDALAAQVGGIGIAPGANISDEFACFEATHGSAPKYTGQNKVNPGSIILSAEMMLRFLGWNKAADLIISAMEKTIADKYVTYDFARLMRADGVAENLIHEVSCSGFGDEIIKRM